jgi:hypothetical protein
LRRIPESRFRGSGPFGLIRKEDNDKAGYDGDEAALPPGNLPIEEVAGQDIEVLEKKNCAKKQEQHSKNHCENAQNGLLLT